MAFKLTKEEKATRDKLVVDLHEGWKELEDVRREQENRIQAAIEVLNAALGTYEQVAEAAEAFREEVASRLREEWEEKSEGWQQGDAGEEANSFIEQWENADLTTTMSIGEVAIEVDEGESLSEDLSELPTEQ